MEFYDGNDSPKAELQAMQQLGSGQYQPPTQRQRLMQKKQSLEAILNQVNEAIAPTTS